MIDTSLLAGLVGEILPDVVEVRRAIHRRPELSGEEYATTQLIADTLRRHGLEPRLRTPKTGLTVDLGQGGGPMVAFRSDIDALPISEPAGAPNASEVPGVMHACGHDAHAAIGVGVSLALARLEPPGRVRIVFQPAEETFPGGAFDLVREGVLDGVSSIVGFHVDPGLETGRIGLRPGPITGSADRFYITLEGPGGHTARPHVTVDLLHAAGRVLTDLPALLDRLVDARSPLVVVFGRVQGGTADNVIPTQVELSGTVRTADRDVWDEIPGLLERLVKEIVSPLGAKPIVHYQRGIPPVVNDARIIESLERTVVRVAGEECVSATHVSMGAEDFARYLDEVPGALMRLGCRLGGRRIDLHSAGFVLDEECLAQGVRIGVAAMLDLLDLEVTTA